MKLTERITKGDRMKTYRGKPVEIQAVQWRGVRTELPIYINLNPKLVFDGENLSIETLEGIMKANVTDWIIKGTEGELYPCKNSVFRRKYELAENTEI